MSSVSVALGRQNNSSRDTMMHQVSPRCDKRVTRVVWSNATADTFTPPPPHSGPEHERIQTEILGQSLVRSLIRTHRSLVCLLRTTRFARALCCAPWLARSLAHSAYFLVPGTVNDLMAIFSVFFSILAHSAPQRPTPSPPPRLNKYAKE